MGSKKVKKISFYTLSEDEDLRGPGLHCDACDLEDVFAITDSLGEIYDGPVIVVASEGDADAIELKARREMEDKRYVWGAMSFIAHGGSGWMMVMTREKFEKSRKAKVEKKALNRLERARERVGGVEGEK